MHMPRNESQPSRSWSDYKWSDQYKQWYAEGVDRHGNIIYDWAGPDQPLHNDQSIPRSDHTISTIDQITEGVGGLDVNHGAYSQDQSIDYQTQHATSSVPTTFGLSTSPSYTHDVTHHGHQRSRKEKGKERVEQANSYSHMSRGNIPYQGSNMMPANSYDMQAHSQYPTSNFESGAGHAAAVNMTSSASYHIQGGDNDTEDPAVLEAMQRSRETYYGQSNPGESSYSSSAYASASSAWSNSIDSSTYETNPYAVAEDDATPRNTPAPGALIPPPSMYPNYIQGTDGYEEIMDSRFRVEHSAKFQPGEVFKILWSEPLGQVPGDEPISDIKQQRDGAGKLFHIGFRRFIIVTTDESHHSTCVPILTYDRRGCGKRGVKADKHGIIYSAKYKPKPLKGEPPLGFAPVALNLYAEGEKLAKESRVNYSKLVTIEHNVKVYFIGSIIRSHFDIVQDAVNECWDKKMHRSSKKVRG
ncbi:hypothetical protein F4775DRAFT_601592 [Biscogniauxia sp. FL1348]|nr:hypothetical protein F4775DRAFT_601592 [Biscogniauxia sp. FL1348]